MNKAYQTIVSSLPEHTSLVVVSKKRTLEEIMHYYNLGVRDFGENRADELISKAEALPKDIRWHFIGHLQRNKAAKVLPYVSLIHSVESIELCKAIDKESRKLNKKTPVLIQFNLAEEQTKSGLSLEEAIAFASEALSYEFLEIKGIMCMGPHVDDETEIKRVFQQAHDLLHTLQSEFAAEYFSELSMGMSSDWKIALDSGSTMLRIGSILFEED